MTRMQTIRRGLIAVLALGVMAPPSAMATHNGTCEGFSDPRCNARYVRDHTVGDVTKHLDPVLATVDGLDELALAAVNEARAAANEVLCLVFGAC